MIFASDLDQTLIYSRRSMGEDGESHEPILIETLDGKEISFISRKAQSLLQKVHELACFIPVTTRTMVQYQRITLFQSEILPRYAVTSNGGNILINGRVDEEWRRHIQRELEDNCLPVSDVLHVFSEICDHTWFNSGKMADELFYYAIIERDSLPLDVLLDFEDWLEKQKWTLSVQGRKLYLVPRTVSKGTAIRYIASKEGNPTVLAAGDSLLDLDLLRVADQGFIPGHGEIYRQRDTIIPSQTQVIHDSGIRSSEIILAKVLERLDKDGN